MTDSRLKRLQLTPTQPRRRRTAFEECRFRGKPLSRLLDYGPWPTVNYPVTWSPMRPLPCRLARARQFPLAKRLSSSGLNERRGVDGRVSG